MLWWLRIFALLGAAALAVGGAASGQAAWQLVEGIDVDSGGRSTLLIGELDQSTSLYARCVAGNAELFLDTFDGGTEGIEAVGEVSFTLSTDAGGSWTSAASYLREKSGYVTTRWLAVETIGAVVAGLISAKSSVSISVEFEEVGSSIWDIDAKGSTAAGRAFLDACGIAALAAHTISGSWEYSEGAAAPEYGEKALMLSPVTPAGVFAAIACGATGDDWSLYLLAPHDRDFPFAQGDEGFSVTIAQDDLELAMADGQFWLLPSSRGIRFTDSAVVLQMIGVMSMAPQRIEVTLSHDLSGQSVTYPLAAGLASETATVLFGACSK